VVNPGDDSYAAGVWDTGERANFSTAHWEAAAVYYAVAVYGPQVRNGVLHIHSDSMACVAAFTRARARDARIANILRLCALLQVQHHLHLVLHHIPGKTNTLADRASRTGTPSTTRTFRRRYLPPSLRRLGTTLPPPFSPIPSSDPEPTPRRPRIGTPTQQTSATCPLPRYTWTLWKHLPTSALPPTVDYLTFSDGWSPPETSSPLQPPSTSPVQPDTSRYIITSPTHARGGATKSCAVGVASQWTSSTASLPRRL
jgi:hypothetical protein